MAGEKLPLQSKGQIANKVVKTSSCQVTFPGVPGGTKLDEGTPYNGLIRDRQKH